MLNSIFCLSLAAFIEFLPINNSFCIQVKTVEIDTSIQEINLLLSLCYLGGQAPCQIRISRGGHLLRSKAHSLFNLRSDIKILRDIWAKPCVERNRFV